jgi:hypothetical protein
MHLEGYLFGSIVASLVASYEGRLRNRVLQLAL